MTTLQLIIITCAYLVALLIVIYVTRATSRRLVGAFAGGAAVGVFGMGAIVLALFGTMLAVKNISVREKRRRSMQRQV